MRKVLGALAALFMAAGLLIGFSTPAQAHTGAECFDLYEGNASTCVQFYWTTQVDGTGVDLYRVEVGTFDCAELEDNEPYQGMDMYWRNPANNALWRESHPGATGCNPTFTMDWPGRDEGSMWFTWNAKARLNFEYDRNLHLKVTLQPNGDYNVVTRSNTEV
jgi:hypothetical protein